MSHPASTTRLLSPGSNPRKDVMRSQPLRNLLTVVADKFSKRGTRLQTQQGIFTFNTESEIIECNRFCACSDKCINRVAQIPRNIAIQIFKTENRRGWGARAPIGLSTGQVLGLYTGRRDEAKKLTGSRASYCFDLDINEEPDEDPPANSYSVDAFGCGNWTRFLNHSCSPNLKIISVVYESSPEVSCPTSDF
ncbi:Histone-lysine N-methyltransferase, H3 lysine-9 specific [Mycena venus]|uniref:Histone-lysine N-methyltransferase, H3 lysine-9 specific n=1 Tax=Mycena venus TaxID=2733690 RepID=A0A8H7DDN2_9AGAR|nr:Histone-lysine N-methyltransferase, H3 lysine-9 specific [Mycena venus]